jgi:hydrogenase maturation protein HypF
VQGVGFRPFIYRLASELLLTGWVNNSPLGLFIEAEGPRPSLEEFLRRIDSEKPPRSFVQSQDVTWLNAVGFDKFEIRASETGGVISALVLPDIATCPDCLHDIFDPQNRRFHYPFTNCTNCGPRFSIIEALPYDRVNTSMKSFAMCPACRAEYDDPQDRRFHAQPNACPVCGPHLEFWNETGKTIAIGEAALLAAASAIRQGSIVATKGVGGFHLLADARAEKTVCLLRERKYREEKPFALMYPSLASVKLDCAVSTLEARSLTSPEAPIVLLRKISNRPSTICPAIAPGNPNLGVLLPSNPLYHLLMAELKFPVIATSGNVSDEPICITEGEALERLHGIADFFLVHNRPIIRHVDDSLARVVLDREMILRRARGYAPLPITLNSPLPPGGAPSILAVGAHLKNSIALAVGNNIFLSQHIGDLETEAADHAFGRVIADLQTLYATAPETVAADLHPDYRSTAFAHASGKKVVGVQHHAAHVLSCIAENEIEPPVLGVAWDGTGYGTDGTIWGGEFFLVTDKTIERVASLRPFPLPGGNAAIKEPRRAALGLLFERFGPAIFEKLELPTVAAFTAIELALLKTTLARGLNSPKTSSVGRLFDAVASLANIRQQMQFEGQAAMELEFALDGLSTVESYEFPLVTHPLLCILDWMPLVDNILSDRQRGTAAGEISAKFHNTLAEAVITVARKFGPARVALSGGCFQNRYLTERIVARLRAEKFRPYWHQRVPANDGGIALGQIFAARNQLNLK